MSGTSSSNADGEMLRQRIESAYRQVAGERANWASVDFGPARTEPPRLLFPGSFNPLHSGHREMARVAIERIGGPLCYELSIRNADKPAISLDETWRRLVTSTAGDEKYPAFAPHGLVLTNAPRFVDKSELFLRSMFIVGVDTILRIAETRYYQSNPERRDQAIERLARNEARFMVFGRCCEGRFQTLNSISIPSSLRNLCINIAETSFRYDISSSYLRDQRENGL